MNLLFDVEQKKKLRVIIDTDAACEADDPYAIAHALLSPKLIVEGIVAEHFNCEGSMERSYEEIKTILKLMGSDVKALKGQKTRDDSSVSEGVQFIINQAKEEADNPLYLLCLGAITNVAKAISLKPDIASQINIIWIGTHGPAPIKAPFREFNAGNDIKAANTVLESGANVWLVPSTVYSTINIGIAELQRRIRPCGLIGKHLFNNLVEFNKSEDAFWTQGESWSLGDSPAVALALNPSCGKFVEVKAPFISEDTSSVENENGNLIRIYTSVDSRYLLEDMIAKLELFSGNW